MTNTNPGNGDSQVPIHRPIEFLINQKISDATVEVTDLNEKNNVTGTVEIKENKVLFHLFTAFYPIIVIKWFYVQNQKRVRALRNMKYIFPQ
ncbi:hypothetical protein Dred_2975 [Desulforamulus reducens MI-1]|uniref:Uncharacterized protein n=1 Tax=Desulforamulus reducens (strain ATCC BAA-1160 / DSM 100696 / MI-1) TaxID=349161 RepID=A4J8S5_DESRM|nr:hypothetical protein [Desulforamulus reducens]ABO51478.1 hypothetical protein Dred_2975 [Desulforamulus reducens MI-1]